MKQKSAFTLAEVLITLGIIGVVAAMTIPTLMQNSGKSELKTSYKKILSAVNQAITMSVALDYIDFGDAYDGVESDSSIYKILTDRMHVIKAVGDGITGDIAGKEEDLGSMFKIPATVASDHITLFFSDGMVISYPKTAKNCTKTKFKDNDCTAIVDVNGLKKPNKLANCQWNASTGGSSSVENDNESSTTTCDNNNLYVGDQYSVAFKGQQLVPNGATAKYVLYQK